MKNGGNFVIFNKTARGQFFGRKGVNYLSTEEETGRKRSNWGESRELAACLREAPLGLGREETEKIADAVVGFFKGALEIEKEEGRIIVSSDLIPGRHLRIAFDPDALAIVRTEDTGVETFVSNAPVCLAWRISERGGEEETLVFSLKDRKFVIIQYDSRFVSFKFDHYQVKELTREQK